MISVPPADWNRNTNEGSLSDNGVKSAHNNAVYPIITRCSLHPPHAHNRTRDRAHGHNTSYASPPSFRRHRAIPRINACVPDKSPEIKYGLWFAINVKDDA